MTDGMGIVPYREGDAETLLRNGMIVADRFVSRNYMIDISKQGVIPFGGEVNRAGIRMFQILKLVYDKKENINDKLISVYSALENHGSSAMLIIISDGESVDFYIAVYSDNSAATAGEILAKSFQGNFAGSILGDSLNNSEIEKVMQRATSSDAGGQPKVSCVSVVPSMRDEDKDRFVQGMEKFIDTMQHEEYSAIILARPLEKGEVELTKRGYEEMYSALSPFAKTSVAFGQNESESVSSGMFQNFSESINNSVANTTGGTSSSSEGYSTGRTRGSSFGLPGTGFNSGTSQTSSSGYTSGYTWTKSVTEGTTSTEGGGRQEGESRSKGMSRTITVDHFNKSAQNLMDIIEENLKRIRECEAFGIWDCAAYFIADEVETSIVAANTYKALMSGDQTSVQNAFINVWGIEREDAETALRYLRWGQHPLIRVPAEDGYDGQVVTPGLLVSGKELPLIMGLPQKSVPGVSVSSFSEFGRNVFSKGNGGEWISVGRIYHMGKTEDTEVFLDVKSMAAHCFITGSTGSGKSFTTRRLLEGFVGRDIPFLVIEPAKGEYKEFFGGLAGINVFTTNPLFGRLLKLNPFRFNSKIHILEHLDRLIEIFTACWEMYAAMPAVLKEAIEQVYINKGWDLLNSIYLCEGEPEYPTFEDLVSVLPEIIAKSDYSAEVKGNYTGALVTRVSSLSNGILGQVFCDDIDLSDEILFDRNTIVDLSRVGAAETKALIMGILILRLTEYRSSTETKPNSELRHITVMEEAHHLLKRPDNHTEESNVVAKSVEMICNSIAEMRTYGEGFIIVDQSPTSVDKAAIKNTNTKICMRLPDRKDGEEVGYSVSLDEDQTGDISRLETGVAVVMQNDWTEAVLTKIHPATDRYIKIEDESITHEQIRQSRGILAAEIIRQYIEERRMNPEDMHRVINGLPVPEQKKEEYRFHMDKVVQTLENQRDFSFFCHTLLTLTGTKEMFNVLKRFLVRKKELSRGYSEESIKHWVENYVRALVRFVDIPRKYMECMMVYLVYAMIDVDRSVSYHEIYEYFRSGNDGNSTEDQD